MCLPQRLSAVPALLGDALSTTTMTSTAEGTQGLQTDAELSFSCTSQMRSGFEVYLFRALTFVLA